MKSISLEKAFDILQKAPAITVDGVLINSFAVSQLEGKDDHEFMYLEWSDDKDYIFDTTFSESNNREVFVEGTRLRMINREGDEVEIEVLEPKNLEQSIE